jgi:hypothetical protein
MNTRFSLVALTVAIAVLSLALVITVVGATASSVNVDAIGFGAEVDNREVADNRLLAYKTPDISQDEPLSLTEPISIYLPLLEKEYVKFPAERAALMALYNSTNRDWWINNTG